MNIITLIVILSTLTKALLAIRHGYDHDFEMKKGLIVAHTHNLREIIGSFDHCLVYWTDSHDKSNEKLSFELSKASKILKSAYLKKDLPPIIKIDLRHPVNHEHDASSDEQHPPEKVVPLDSEIAKFYRLKKIPMLTFFKEGNPFPFHPKNMTAEGISHTARHMSKPLIRYVDDLFELRGLLKDSFSYKVVYFGPEHHHKGEKTHHIFREVEEAAYKLEGIIKGAGDKGTE